jgi:2-C-methyl-D-erythritol 4-phosphate cytidylyltransferase
LELDECERVVIVAAQDEMDVAKEAVWSLNSLKIIFVSGGERRQDSVENGMRMCVNEVVLIHDGARVMIEKPYIMAVSETMKSFHSAALAVRVTDTIREMKDGKMRMLDRDGLYAMQTPQGVRRNEYLRAAALAQNDNYFGTDDVELIEKYLSIPPVLVEGSYDNFKVTNIQDIRRLEAVMEGE